MISMRYHIVSLAAVFLALALGIVLGATKISSPLISGLQSDNQDLTSNQQQLSATNADLTERVTGDDKFAGAVGPLTVRGTLPNTTVLLLTTADADPADRDAVLSLLTRSGATVTGQVQLTADLTNPGRADELRTLATQNLPTGATLPEVPQVGSTVGGLLSALLVAKPDNTAPASPEQTAAALGALTGSGFVVTTGDVAPARSVVLLTGGAQTGGSEADRAAVLADLSTQLKSAASGVVVAGRSGSADATGAVGVIRANTAQSAVVTTVDSVDTGSGRVATVLGLVEQNGGGVGRYGLADNAQAQVPTLALG